MTAEELIIGHYEKSLTSEQESHLAAMVDASPDVRVLFEQHGNIQAMMVEEAETIETSSKLDKIVLGAALGTLAEIAGHGVGISLIGKLAAVVGTLAVGGAGFLLYNSITSDDAAPVASPPAAHSGPSTSAPAAPTPSPAGTQLRTESPAPIESSSDAASAAGTSRVATSATRSRRDDAPSTRAESSPTPRRPLQMNEDSADVTVTVPTRTRPGDTSKGK